jgi:uncharacterized protein YndB with AHSA1/START domain
MAPEARPGAGGEVETRRYGSLEQRADGRFQLRFTRTLGHPVDRVWQVVTEPDQLARWFPTTIEGERVAGAALRFTFPGGEAPPFDGEMLACDPPSLLEFRWGPDVMRLELRPVPHGTELTLLHTLDERGKGARDAAGWHTCLDALARALRGDDAARTSMSTWAEVHPWYVAHFGPEAATIGPPEGF